MRQRIYLIFFATFALRCMAQSIGEAFYVYRNDGGFNAFFRDDVQSIEYSYEDVDGKTYDEIVTQIINTRDSVYKIPLVAIDSVSFVQPQTIFQPDVIQMNQKGLMNYLKDVSGMTLLFENTIPKEILPKVGNVLLYTDFESSLLKEGFAGKVIKTQMTSDAFRVECDSIYNFFDIYEQLTFVEKITDNNTKVRSRAENEWISSHNQLNFNLGYSREFSDGEASLSGSVDGTYIATAICNITRQNQYINLKINHDWQYGAHLKFKTNRGFGTLFGPVAQLPPIRPASAPIFKFQIAGAPFVKGNGNMELDLSLNSSVNSYVSQVIYHNGVFTGWNHEIPIEGGNNPTFESTFSLNGSIQVGYMVDLWLGLDVGIKGIAENIMKLGTELDFYIGPKLNGDFSIKLGTENPVNYYSTYKDSKLCLSLLTVDYEFFGEASLAGIKSPKAIFCEGSIQSPFYHEWYVLPEFSELDVFKDSTNKEAIIKTIPTRDILFPLKLGIGLYDSKENLLNTKYEIQNYKRQNENFTIEQTFQNLKKGINYTVKPFIKILDGEVPAFPSQSFEIKEEKANLCPDENHPHMIDLGLPSGTKWACCNLGASKPEEFGGYYSWGETQTKSHYSWENYTHYYYNNRGEQTVDIGHDIAGTIYDAATVNWGTPWRMPTLEQYTELYKKCNSTWTTINGVNGRKYTSPNGNVIFLPASSYGNFRPEDPPGSDSGRAGYYWSSNFIHADNANCGWIFYFWDSYEYCNIFGCHRGHTIRAVRAQ